jgi:hypothetical protein
VGFAGAWICARARVACTKRRTGLLAMTRLCFFFLFRLSAALQLMFFYVIFKVPFFSLSFYLLMMLTAATTVCELEKKKGVGVNKHLLLYDFVWRPGMCWFGSLCTGWIWFALWHRPAGMSGRRSMTTRSRIDRLVAGNSWQSTAIRKTTATVIIITRWAT